MKKYSHYFGIILSLLLLMNLSLSALAAGDDPVVTFDAKTELFSYKNTEVASNGNPKLFFGFEGAIPGDSFTQEIQLKTKNIKDKKINIYLHSENPNEDYHEIMERVLFTVYYEGEVLSEGTLAEGIKLGSFTSNESRDFTVEFQIPLEVDNRIEKLYGTIDWVFIAELIEEPGSSKEPKTGDDTDYVLWIALAAVGITGIIVYGKRCKNKNK